MSLSGLVRKVAVHPLIDEWVFAALNTLAGHTLAIPYYHIVSDVDVPHIRHLYKFLDSREFSKGIDFLLSHYRPITVLDLCEHVRSGKRLPDRSFFLTFDDGLSEMYHNVLPILEGKGLRGTFFVCSGFVDNKDMDYHHKASLLVDHLGTSPDSLTQKEVLSLLAEAGIASKTVSQGLLSVRYAQRAVLDRIAELTGYSFAHYLSTTRPYLTSEQMREMLARGHYIGAHSIDHPEYSALQAEEQVRQTIESVNTITGAFGLDYRLFAFPNSDRGVRSDVFCSLYEKYGVHGTFGTSGLGHSEYQRHFQRIKVENMSMSMRQILSRQLMRRGGNRLSLFNLRRSDALHTK